MVEGSGTSIGKDDSLFFFKLLLPTPSPVVFRKDVVADGVNQGAETFRLSERTLPAHKLESAKECFLLYILDF